MKSSRNDQRSLVPGPGQLLNPVLRAVHSLGGTASISDIEKFVIDNEGISEEQLSVLVNVRPKTVLSKNLAAARTLLRAYGVLSLVRAGTWTLSEEGKSCYTVDVSDVYKRKRLLKESRAKAKSVESAGIDVHSHPNTDELPRDRSYSSFEVDFLMTLESVIRARKNTPVSGSYTASLFSKGTNKIAQKVGEEATEVVVAALGQGRNEQINEIADLVVHLLVLMAQLDISLDEVCAELERRHRPR